MIVPVHEDVVAVDAGVAVGAPLDVAIEIQNVLPVAAVIGAVDLRRGFEAIGHDRQQFETIGFDRVAAQSVIADHVAVAQRVGISSCLTCRASSEIFQDRGHTTLPSPEPIDFLRERRPCAGQAIETSEWSMPLSLRTGTKMPATPCGTFLLNERKTATVVVAVAVKPSPKQKQVVPALRSAVIVAPEMNQ